MKDGVAVSRTQWKKMMRRMTAKGRSNPKVKGKIRKLRACRPAADTGGEAGCGTLSFVGEDQGSRRFVPVDWFEMWRRSSVD